MSWSYSQLKDYETCPHRLTLNQAGAKRTTNPHAEAGIAAHSTVEEYLTDRTDTLPPYPAFHKDLESLHHRRAMSEHKLGVDRHWCPIVWEKAWGRAIIDILSPNPVYIEAIDIKSGKPHPIAHIDQAQTYALFINAHYPNVPIHFDFWYLTGKRVSYKFSVADLGPIRSRVTARALRAELDAKKLPRPNKFACGYCAFNQSCEYVNDDHIEIP